MLGMPDRLRRLIGRLAEGPPRTVAQQRLKDHITEYAYQLCTPVSMDLMSKFKDSFHATAWYPSSCAPAVPGCVAAQGTCMKLLTSTLLEKSLAFFSHQVYHEDQRSC